MSRAFSFRQPPHSTPFGLPQPVAPVEPQFRLRHGLPPPIGCRAMPVAGVCLALIERRRGVENRPQFGLPGVHDPRAPKPIAVAKCGVADGLLVRRTIADGLIAEQPA